MGSASFSLDGDSRIRLSGEVDMSNARQLATALAGLTGTDLVVDCSELTFIDSSGLNALAVAYKRRSDIGGRLRVVGANDAVARVVRLIGFPEWLEPDQG